MSRTKRSQRFASPSSARRKASSKVSAEVRKRARPRKVPPPQAVPPTRTKSFSAGEFTRMMETPEPIFTKRKGNICSGHGKGSGPPSSPTVKRPPSRGPRAARTRSPSTTAASSRTGTSSTCRASRNSGANLWAPPPAVKRRRGVLVQGGASGDMTFAKSGRPKSKLSSSSPDSDAEALVDGVGAASRAPTSSRESKSSSGSFVPSEDAALGQESPMRVHLVTSASICAVDPDTNLSS
mmetsp:Transcript_9599/g.21481  ORF Transcript_9599/g.21481 Transcript_9599/m.21481 type:complete len:238 (+) Transcript_9599:542-1255(+)